ncbi:MAG: amino acid adenylation enzyme/thioester reductase family protein, partial [bacterium]
IRIVCLDKDWSIISEQSSENLNKEITSDSLAYILYTSGTTGKPKGVMITHANLSNYTQSIAKAININDSDRYLHSAVLTFSASVKQFAVPLSSGATVVIASLEEIVDPIASFQLIKDQCVTIVERVGSYWSSATQALLNLAPETLKELLNNKLRLAMSAGEVLLTEVPKTWQESFKHPAKFINMYGQTENTGTVATYNVPTDYLDKSKIVPIGRPLSNTFFYILDNYLQPVPIGAIGELYIGGLSLSQGYLNQPELTKERFIPNPFDSTFDSTFDSSKNYIYKTGDLAKYREDGVIEFCGRQDYQIKIRGIRIELAEIEFLIKQHPKIKNAVVIAKDSPQAGEKYLVAYIITYQEAVLFAELQTFLQEKIPSYMVPSLFIKLDIMPLTANGKINLRALSEIEQPIENQTDFGAPITETEKIIAKVCCELLKIDKVGREDNFFELGIHSLLVTQITIRLQEIFAIDLPFRSLFESPTVAELANDIELMLANKSELIFPKVVASQLQSYPLALAQLPIWISSQLQPNISFHHIHQNFLLTGKLNLEVLEKSVNEVVSRHSALRLIFLNIKGKLIQQINPNTQVPLTVIDLGYLPASERLEAAHKLILEEVKIKFDLTKGPLLRTKILKINDTQHALLLTYHHIMIDGWSLAIFLNDLGNIYQAFLNNSPLPPPPKFQYLDFVHWQYSLLASDLVKSQLSYWKDKLGKNLKTPQLPIDYPKPKIASTKGASQIVAIEKETFFALIELSKQTEVTLFMTLVA